MKMEEKKKQGAGGDFLVPRQFMDLGPAATGETDEPTQSSSEGRSRRSPPNNVEVVSREFHPPNSIKGDNISQFDQEKTNVDEHNLDHDHASQDWIPNKVPKLSTSKNNADQSTATTETTMRKARVSVRAISEAPMVINYQSVLIAKFITIVTY